MPRLSKRQEVILDIQWAGLEWTAKGEYFPGDPGRCSGPPENCYPPEPPEVNLSELKLNGKDFSELLESDLVEDIQDAFIERMAELEQCDDEGPEDHYLGEM
jgi:hypothetical protein